MSDFEIKKESREPEYSLDTLKKKKGLRKGGLFLLGILVMLAMGSCADVGPEAGCIMIDPGINLSAMSASIASSIQFFNSENTYSFPFYVAGVIIAEPDITLPLTNDGVPMSPLGSDENVVLETMCGGAVVNSGLVDWATEKTQFEFQGSGTPTEAWSYDSIEGYYKFVVNKSRFNYGVDSLIFCSTYMPSALGGPGAGIGQNVLPVQNADGVGALNFDVAITNLNLSNSCDSAIKWVATNTGNSSITMIGIKNGQITFGIYLKGSVVATNVLADLTNTTDHTNIWAQFMIVLGKGIAPTDNPVFTQTNGSTFTTTLDVTIISATPGNVILWTTNAWTATNTGALTIDTNTTVSAIATNANRPDSYVVTSSYTKN